MTQKEEYTQQANEMKVMSVHGRAHVIRPVERYKGSPQANYRGSRMGLVAVLYKGESLESFKKMWIKRKMQSNN